MILRNLLVLLLTSLIAASFTGCAKKPRRPNPLDTVMGGGAGSGGNQTDFANLGAGDFEDQSDALEVRSNDPYANAVRGLLPTVFFDFNSSAIKASERAKLDQAAQYVRSNPGSKLVLEGHCDWRGTAAYNLGLGDRRATSVSSYLKTLGLSEGTLVTLSKGDLDSAEGASEAAMAQDRRVEVNVLR